MSKQHPFLYNGELKIDGEYAELAGFGHVGVPERGMVGELPSLAYFPYSGLRYCGSTFPILAR